jgi:hypothetical protein
MLSNILLSRSAPYADEVTGNHQRGFNNILTEFGVPMKLGKLIKICLN